MSMTMKPADRRGTIYEAGVRVARQVGLRNVTHKAVAGECVWPTSVKTVWRVIGKTEKLVKGIAWYARRNAIADVVAQADEMGI